METGREHGDAEHDKSHVATLGKIKDDAGGKVACRQKEARLGLHGNGAVGVGECDHVVPRVENKQARITTTAMLQHACLARA